MKIEIKLTDNPIVHYQVKIVERLNTLDELHSVNRVTTSPEMLSEQDAINWLIKYLKLTI